MCSKRGDSSPELHQSLVLNAANQKMTLNAYIKTVLEQEEELSAKGLPIVKTKNWGSGLEI